MWLRNWDNIKILQLINTNQLDTTDRFGNNSLILKDTDGELLNPCQETIRAYYGYKINNYSDNPVIVGTVGKNSYRSYGLRTSIYNLSLKENAWDNATSLTEYKNFNANADFSITNLHGPVLLVGSGTNQTTYEDYTITPFYNSQEEEVSLSHSCYNISSPCYDTANRQVSFVVSRTLFNNTDEDITVKELGIAVFCGYTTNDAPAVVKNSRILVYRENIDPVTIYNRTALEGTSKTFSIKICIKLS